MQSSVTYNKVSQEDDNGPPPDYEAVLNSQECELERLQRCDVQDNQKSPDNLPSYQLATNLPSYDDSQGIKNEQLRQENPKPIFNPFLNVEEANGDDAAAGSDCEFMFAFIVSFFFNWFGFFMGYCVLGNSAGKYGAISGFGLSLINGLLYLKYAKEGNVYVTEEGDVLWWFFLGFATLLTTLGLLNWAKARKVRDTTSEEREDATVVLY